MNSNVENKFKKFMGCIVFNNFLVPPWVAEECNRIGNCSVAWMWIFQCRIDKIKKRLLYLRWQKKENEFLIKLNSFKKVPFSDITEGEKYEWNASGRGVTAGSEIKIDLKNRVWSFCGISASNTKYNNIHFSKEIEYYVKNIKFSK